MKYFSFVHLAASTFIDDVKITLLTSSSNTEVFTTRYPSLPMSSSYLELSVYSAPILCFDILLLIFILQLKFSMNCQPKQFVNQQLKRVRNLNRLKLTAAAKRTNHLCSDDVFKSQVPAVFADVNNRLV